MVWQGTAADKAEALKCAENADPRVDLEWMRIRYERDLDIRQVGFRLPPTRTCQAVLSQPNPMKLGFLQTGEEGSHLD